MQILPSGRLLVHVIAVIYARKVTEIHLRPSTRRVFANTFGQSVDRTGGLPRKENGSHSRVALKRIEDPPLHLIGGTDFMKHIRVMAADDPVGLDGVALLPTGHRHHSHCVLHSMVRVRYGAHDLSC